MTLDEVSYFLERQSGVVHFSELAAIVVIKPGVEVVWKRTRMFLFDAAHIAALNDPEHTKTAKSVLARPVDNSARSPGIRKSQ
jgi:hypothetical protein